MSLARDRRVRLPEFGGVRVNVINWVINKVHLHGKRACR